MYTAMKNMKREKKCPMCPKCGSQDTRPATNFGKVFPGRFQCMSDLYPCSGIAGSYFDMDKYEETQKAWKK